MVNASSFLQEEPTFLQEEPTFLQEEPPPSPFASFSPHPRPSSTPRRRRAPLGAPRGGDVPTSPHRRLPRRPQPSEHAITH